MRINCKQWKAIKIDQKTKSTKTNSHFGDLCSCVVLSFWGQDSPETSIEGRSPCTHCNHVWSMIGSLQSTAVKIANSKVSFKVLRTSSYTTLSDICTVKISFIYIILNEHPNFNSHETIFFASPDNRPHATQHAAAAASGLTWVTEKLLGTAGRLGLGWFFWWSIGGLSN